MTRWSLANVVFLSLFLKSEGWLHASKESIGRLTSRAGNFAITTTSLNEQRWKLAEECTDLSELDLPDWALHIESLTFGQHETKTTTLQVTRESKFTWRWSIQRLCG